MITELEYYSNLAEIYVKIIKQENKISDALKNCNIYIENSQDEVCITLESILTDLGPDIVSALVDLAYDGSVELCIGKEDSKDYVDVSTATDVVKVYLGEYDGETSN